MLAALALFFLSLFLKWNVLTGRPSYVKDYIVVQSFQGANRIGLQASPWSLPLVCGLLFCFFQFGTRPGFWTSRAAYWTTFVLLFLFGAQANWATDGGKLVAFAWLAAAYAAWRKPREPAAAAPPAG